MIFEELIQARRSIRAYEMRKPDHETLETILRQAQQAPSWKNLQTARTYVVEDDALLAQVRDCLPSFNQRSSANAVLLVTTFVRGLSGFTGGTPDNEVGDGWGAYDLGLRDAYLILAAKNAGLDTLIMGLRDANRLRDLLQIPKEEEILSVIAVGYGAQEITAKGRKAPKEVSRWF